MPLLSMPITSTASGVVWSIWSRRLEPSGATMSGGGVRRGSVQGV
eukprot:CAMPEP_0174726280 /NCGR_PEP_ID=MMETSP1094-20130205/47406_1 /TAXON_ID=156173 /ORGANISM="Chrysochromulina brevifilum, Strain UTEX LB 985" /LENGTH=44 /DNA_ID= /DNA_START= /DNA_END= /DNA_ORIENTATION=